MSPTTASRNKAITISRLAFISLLLLLLLPAWAFAQAPILTDENVVFCTHGGVSLKIDIAYPQEVSDRRPALLFVPGNGWGHWGGMGYDRREYSGAIRLAAAHGYVAAAVEYRSSKAGQCPYPAQLLDVRTAVRWLRANSEKYHLNPDRVGAVGWSSGGHLALLLGLLDGSARSDEADYPEYSSKVQAVVSLAGPTELALMYKEATYPGIPAAIAELMGGPPDLLIERYKDASPLYHVSDGASPMLLIQGDRDSEVPPDQATLLYQKMQDAGANVTMIVLNGKAHLNAYNHEAVFPFLDNALELEK